jgi:iron(III) transport system substrate-binding protein
LTKLLNTKADKYQKKVTSYDAEKSASDSCSSIRMRSSIPRSGTSSRRWCARGANMQSSTGTMMERIASGENLIGYNISALRDHAREEGPVDRRRLHDRLQPRAVASRLRREERQESERGAPVGRLTAVEARHTITAEQAELYSVRTDMTGKESGVAFAKELGSAVETDRGEQRSAAGPRPNKRLEFLKQWQGALGRK